MALHHHNIESYFMSDLPGVFINKVTLDIAGDKVTGTPFNKNPHIVQHVEDPELVESSESETLEVQIDFNLKIRTRFDKASKDLLSSWIFNKYFLDYYKIAVIIAKDPETYLSLSNKIYSPEHEDPSVWKDQITSAGNSPLMETNILSLVGDNGLFNLTAEEDINDYLKSLESEIYGNMNVYNIPFSHKVSYNETYPGHLSVFVMPYLDLDQIKMDYDLEDLDIEFVFGQPIVELIIHNGKTGAQKRLFHEQPTAEEIANFIPTLNNPSVKGKIYAGPAHQMPDGAWRKGEYSGHMDDAPLIVKQIKNNVIQDMRIAKALEKISFNYSLIENDKLGLSSPKLSALINDNLDVVRNPSYISPLSISKDHDGQCRFFFSIDYLTMVKKNSVFKILFERSQPSQIESLLKGSIIRHLKFFRKRVKGRNSGLINKLGLISGPVDFDPNKSVDILINTGDQIRNHSDIFSGGTRLYNQTIKRNYNTFIDESEQDPDLNIRIASFREVDLLTPTGENRSNYPRMRHFTGVDSEISMMTDGFYQYGVEIEIEDPTVNYMESKLSVLADLIAIYEEYYEIASGINKSQVALTNFGEEVRGAKKLHNFSSIAQKYVPEFLGELMSHEEGSTLRQIGLDADSDPSTTHTIESHIGSYFGTLQLLTVDEIMTPGGIGGLLERVDEDTKEFVEGLAKVLDPVTGTPTGISVFLKLLNNLAINMERLLDSAISGPVNKSPANNESPESPLSRFKVDATRTFKMSKYFSEPQEIFDAETPKSLGIDYITSYMFSESSARGVGSSYDISLISINTGDYLERVFAETSKFFGPGGTWHLPQRPTNQVEAELDMSPNQIKALYGIITFMLFPTFDNVDMLVDLDRLKNKLFNRDAFGFIYTNCMNLARVEILSGYHINNSAGQNEAQMKKPIFNLLDATQWDKLSEFSSPNTIFARALCRLRSDGNKSKALDIPIYNEYFFLRRAASVSGVPASDGDVNLTTPWKAAQDRPLETNAEGFPVMAPGTMFHHPISILPYKYSHFAPSEIHIRKNLSLDVLKRGFNQDSWFYNPDRYNEILLEALRYNNGSDISFRPYKVDYDPDGIGILRSRQRQKVRGNLIDFMASKSCTINNMSSFMSKIENNANVDLCKDTADMKKTVDAEEQPGQIDFLQTVVSPKAAGLDAISWDSTDPTHILSKLTNYFMTDFNIMDLQKYNMYAPEEPDEPPPPASEQPTTGETAEEGATTQGEPTQTTTATTTGAPPAGTTETAGTTESPVGGGPPGGPTGPSGPPYS